MNIENKNQIINFYKKNIKKYGVNNKGLAWNSSENNELRYLMIEKIIKKNHKNKINILDFGCGLSGLHIFLKKKKLIHNYTGIDTSKKVIQYCKKKFKKNKYLNLNILKKKITGSYEIVILNGIFTIKDEMSQSHMYKYIISILKKLKPITKNQMIINFLTDKPDWKNARNFYPDYKILKDQIKKIISRNFKIFEIKKIYEKILVINFR